MKRTLFLICLFLCLINVNSQNIGTVGGKNTKSLADTTTIKPEIRSWQIYERLGFADTCSIDTAITSFQDNTPINNYSIANSWSGNLGSPVESKMFFNRTMKTPFMFSIPYDAYTINVEDVKFFNTKTPYSNMTYRTSLPRFQEEDYFKALYTMNFNKHLNVGGLANLILGRGQYQHQANRNVNGGFWASFSGKRYEFASVVMFNDFRNQENGGITSVEDLKNTRSYRYVSVNLPDNIGATSKYKSSIFFLNHKYHIGTNKEIVKSNGSITKDFVPIISFIHSIKYEKAQKLYRESNAATDFYKNTYFSTKSTNDSVRFRTLKNTLAVNIEEKFNTLLKFGAAVFIEHETNRYTNFSENFKFVDIISNDLILGTEISKKNGLIKYNIGGNMVCLGSRLGDFTTFANIDYNFKIFNDTINIYADGNVSNMIPLFFQSSYISNHFKWDKIFNRTLDSRVYARVSSQKTGISLGFNFANIKNYIYFNQEALPSQHPDNIQIMAFDIKANLKFWKIHSDNQAVYQISSKKNILPLPALTLYSNLYFKSIFFKVLTTQIGLSCSYNTAYYGNAYMPATGQFYLQNQAKIGNYPDLNIYANFHLKRIRFYIQYAHLNMYRFGGDGYFLMPNYPINPSTFQAGFSWVFLN